MSGARIVVIAGVLAALAVSLGAQVRAREPSSAYTRPIPRDDRGDALVLGGDGPASLVLLHGLGSRPEELVSVAGREDLPPGLRIVLPRAPASTRPPEGRVGGHKWWSFPGDFHDLRHVHIPGVTDARARIVSTLDRDVPRDAPLVLGGFSQGAMLALDVAAHDPRPLRGLVLFSGTLLDVDELAPRLRSRGGLRVLVVHGRDDRVLPFARALDLVRALEDAGLDVTFVPFDGGHEVTSVGSSAFSAFLREVLE